MHFRKLASSFVLVVACTESKPEAAGSKPEVTAGAPEAAQQPHVWINNKGECKQTVEFECKPGRTCNPPPPREVKCPEGMREEWLADVKVDDKGECTHKASPIFCPPEFEPKPEPTTAAPIPAPDAKGDPPAAPDAKGDK